MKTTKLLSFSLMLLLAGSFKGAAQATQASNAVTNGNSYLGTSNNFDVPFKRQAVAAGLIGTNTTSFGLNTTALPNSAVFGVNAGQYTSGSGYNTYIGQMAGKGQSASILNSGTANTYIGYGAGFQNTTGGYNVCLGAQAGYTNFSGNSNVYIGYYSGFEESNNSSGNVFIGYNSGFAESGSNKLVIGNSETSQLIWGDFSSERLKLNGKVAIGGTMATPFGSFPSTAGGITVSSYNLFVKGGILTEEVRVSVATGWADYVFKKDYNLKPLSEVENFIKEEGHLPNVPSAAQVKEEGIALGEMAKIQQEKIEELTLYIIELNKRLEAQEKKINELTKGN